jgi:poly(A) polymerase
MPIITPAYPSMCATHNITVSNKLIIVRELQRASDITQQILDGKKTWSDLFEKETFFTQGYKYYLSVVAAAKDKEAHAKWSGLVESKVRRLVGGIETSDAGVEVAHPYNKGFERVHRCKNEDEVDKVCQGELTYQVKELKTQAVDVSMGLEGTASATDGTTEQSNGESKVETTDGEILVYTKTFYVGIELQDGMFASNQSRRVQC